MKAMLTRIAPRKQISTATCIHTHTHVTAHGAHQRRLQLVASARARGLERGDARIQRSDHLRAHCIQLCARDHAEA